MKLCVLAPLRLFLPVIVVVGLLPAARADAQIVLQPADSGNADAFVYQFLPTINFSSGQFGILLSAGNTVDGTNDGHNTDSLLQFDLSSSATGIASTAQLTSATLQLFAISSTADGFGADPSPANPITLTVQTLSGTWSAATVTYGTLPPVTSNLYPSAVQNGINQWVTFNVTSEVQNWLNGTISNDGFLIAQASAVDVNGQPAIGVYDSTLGAQASSSPTLAPKLVLEFASSPSLWSQAVSGSWSNPNQWTGGVPNGPAAGAQFSVPSSVQVAVALDGPETIGTLQFGNSAGAAAGYSLTGSNTLTLDNSGAPATIAVVNGNHLIDAPVALEDALQVNVSEGTLTFGEGGSISGTGPLALSGTAGALILSGSDTYTDGTSVSSGTLIVNAEAALPDGSNLTVGAEDSFTNDSTGGVASLESAGQALNAVPVPEPESWLLVAAMLLGLAARRSPPKISGMFDRHPGH